MNLEKYNGKFLNELEKNVLMYMLVGMRSWENPMWFQYQGIKENHMKFKNSQCAIYFYIPLLEEDRDGEIVFDKAYEHFKKLKYKYIEENFPSVYKEIKP